MARAEDFIRNSARNQLTQGQPQTTNSWFGSGQDTAVPSTNSGVMNIQGERNPGPPRSPKAPQGERNPGPTGSNPPVSGMEGLYGDMPPGPGTGDPYDPNNWSPDSLKVLMSLGLTPDQIIFFAEQLGDPYSANPGNPEYLIQLIKSGMYSVSENGDLMSGDEIVLPGPAGPPAPEDKDSDGDGIPDKDDDNPYEHPGDDGPIPDEWPDKDEDEEEEEEEEENPFEDGDIFDDADPPRDEPVPDFDIPPGGIQAPWVDTGFWDLFRDAVKGDWVDDFNETMKDWADWDQKKVMAEADYRFKDNMLDKLLGEGGLGGGGGGGTDRVGPVGLVNLALKQWGRYQDAAGRKDDQGFDQGAGPIVDAGIQPSKSVASAKNLNLLPTGTTSSKATTAGANQQLQDVMSGAGSPMAIQNIAQITDEAQQNELANVGTAATRGLDVAEAVQGLGAQSSAIQQRKKLEDLRRKGQILQNAVHGKGFFA
tara:strand:+ start:1485 stop:2924 length:1440 start_codon:yes stop_codon:yes gene_type:complete